MAKRLTRAQRAARARLVEATKMAVDDWCDRPMIWGWSDCALAQADIEVVALGRDPASELRYQYSSRSEALVVLGPGGLIGEMDRVARRLCLRRVDPAKARQGDIGLANTESGPALVRRYGRGWVGPLDYGVTEIPKRDVAIFRAWEIV